MVIVKDEVIVKDITEKVTLFLCLFNLCHQFSLSYILDIYWISECKSSREMRRVWE